MKWLGIYFTIPLMKQLDHTVKLQCLAVQLAGKRFEILTLFNKTSDFGTEHRKLLYPDIPDMIIKAFFKHYHESDLQFIKR